MRHILIAVLLAVFLAAPAMAKVDLVILPEKDKTQLTIYNSADLTLVRENRFLTLGQGPNSLQFSWAGTLIDPTSLELAPTAAAADVDVDQLVFPPRTTNLGVWSIESAKGGDTPMEISYLTSGLSWRAFYMGTLSGDEKTMRLQGYVRVSNQSGEDYENAQVRLIVGTINTIDEIAALAQRQYPYGAPWETPYPVSQGYSRLESEEAMEMKVAMDQSARAGSMAPKEIVKQGLSEYFLYTIEGTETIPNGWSKRLPSFEAAAVPVVNLYKFEEERYGRDVRRFLSFKNDKEHTLGQTPIPGGALRVYRTAGEENQLAYEGQSSFQYIPVDEDVELDLGPSPNVLITPVLMDTKTANFTYDKNGDIDGWDEIQTYEITVQNTRPLPISTEIRRNFPNQYWDLDSDYEHEQIDLDTIQYTVPLPPNTTKKITYTLTTHQGRRQE